jgi:uncharacterized protein
MNESKTTKSMIYKTDALIEGWYALGGSQMCVLLLPPHPAFGGKISNSILRLAHNSFYEAGFTTLRINFRGVGMSKGTPNDRSMDLQDALHCLDWLSTKHGDPKILWVAGFAYGAHTAINVAMRRPGVHGFIAITPYTDNNEFNILTPCPNGNIITGSEDQVIRSSTIKRIASELTSQKGCSILFTELSGADHNYTNHREVLALEISRYINEMTSSETKSILVG